MAHKYSFKQIKEYLHAQPELKFRDLDSLEGVKLKDFLKNFFSLYSENYITIYAKNGVTQTARGKRRSIGDIFRITKYYYPRVALTTVYKEMLLNIQRYKFFSYICGDSGLRVYRDTTRQVYGKGGFFNSFPTDEFGVDFTEFEEFDESLHNTHGGNTGYGLKELKMIHLK